MVVAATFVFFHPPTIVERWDRGREVMAPTEAAQAFASCLDSWAADHLADGIDYERLAELEGKLIAAASPGVEFKGAPEGYVRIHENHHLWSRTRVGKALANGQYEVVYETADLVEPNPFPKGYQ